MDQILVVYKTDTHHSYASRDIIGLATTFNKGILLCHAQASKEGSKIGKEQLHNLTHLKQTQGYKGPGEFQMEWLNVNTLL
jgi:hypothetical protein